MNHSIKILSHPPLQDQQVLIQVQVPAYLLIRCLIGCCEPEPRPLWDQQLQVQ